MIGTDPPPARGSHPMHSIAAYYVVVATDLANREDQHTHQFAVPRRSLRQRLVAAFSSLYRTERAAAQPA
jgi:hypothetical protein